MRLGAYDCVLKKGTLAHQIYTKHRAFKDAKKSLISEGFFFFFQKINQLAD